MPHNLISSATRKTALARIKILEDDQDLDNILKLTFYENVASDLFKDMEQAKQNTLDQLSTAMSDRLDELINTFD